MVREYGQLSQNDIETLAADPHRAGLIVSSFLQFASWDTPIEQH